MTSYHNLKLLSALALITTTATQMTSCKEEDVFRCDDYFLVNSATEGNNYNLLYNASGKLATIAHTGDFPTTVTTYSYDADDVLVSVEYEDVYASPNPVEVKHMFHFDGAGKLVAINRIEDDTHRDSIRFEYDAQGRILKQDYYSLPQIAPEHYMYYQNQYVSDTEVIRQLYIVNGNNRDQFDLISTSTYTLDSNPLPYPIEYYYESASFGNHLFDHNVIAYEITDVPHTSSAEYTFQYNVDGYPTSITLMGSVETFTYNCVPLQP